MKKFLITRILMVITIGISGTIGINLNGNCGSAENDLACKLKMDTCPAECKTPSTGILEESIDWMYKNGLTIYDNKYNFNFDRGLRRDEAAKFYVNLAKLLKRTSYVKSMSQCKFGDINDSRSDLKDIVVESCKLGLFQGSRGKFNPQKQLTNAEAITVLVRLLTGNQNEIGANHWSDNYYKKAYELNLLQNISMGDKNTIAIRGNVGIIIFNGNKIINNNQKNENTDSTNKINTNTGSFIKLENKETTGLNTNNQIKAIENQYKICKEYEVCKGNIISQNHKEYCEGECILPQSFDRRNKHGKNRNSPIKEQGQTSACFLCSCYSFIYCITTRC